MKSQMDKLLLADLARHANYSEKQLLKTGDIGKYAVQILRRRRKTVSRFRLLFVAFVCLPVILQSISAMFSHSQSTSELEFGPTALIAMTLIPTIIEQRASLSRLETLVAVWLLSNEDETHGEDEGDMSTLAQLVLSDA